MPTTVKVSNFGPIASGSVELRPLTVFFGPSNSGKTFLATLVYGLHTITNGFSVLPRPELWQQWAARSAAAGSYSGGSEAVKEIGNFIAHGLSAGKVGFDRLPATYRDLLNDFHAADDGFAGELSDELKRLYNKGSTEELIRIPSPNHRGTITLSVQGDPTHSAEVQSGWEMGATLDGAACATEVNIDPDYVIEMDEGRQLTLPLFEGGEYSAVDRFMDALTVDQILRIFREDRESIEAWFLPASRSGIMLTHRILASAIMRRNTGRKHRSALDAFALPGTVSDFVANLLMFTERRKWDRQDQLARYIETGLLQGRVETRREGEFATPSFIYTPDYWKEGFPLADASSMITELAPLVVYLRGLVEPGDTLIIEEPEAHLHPEVQTKVALAVARMVRAGIRLVITTHSDWLLAEISNLIRAGELKDPRSEREADSTDPPRLRASEVGVWGFEVDPASRASTIQELTFKWIGGVEPPKIFDIAEAMHEQTAQLIREHEDGLGHEIE